MPTAAIRSRPRRSPADSQGWPHITPARSASLAKNQRLHIRVSTTTASTSRPTNRIMMVPRRGRTLNGRGPTGRTVFITRGPPTICRRRLTHAFARLRDHRRQNHPKKTAALPLRKAAGIDYPNGGRVNERPAASAVTQAVRGAFPLRHIIGDHARGFHRRLAELGVTGNLALDALTFGVQQVAQAFQFGHQVFDLAQ